MKRNLILFCLLFFTFNIFSQSEKDYELLKKCDSTTNFIDTDFYGYYADHMDAKERIYSGG